MPAPTVRSSSGLGGPGPSFSISAPAGIQPGDLLLAIEASAGSTDTPSDWVLLSSQSYAAGSQALYLFYKVAGSSEPAFYSFSTTGGAAVWLLALSGADSSPESSVGTSGSSTTLTTGSLTTLQANELLVAAFAINTEQTITPSSLTDLGTISYPATVSLDVAYTTQSSAGSTGTKSASTASSRSWGTLLVAIPPSAGGGSARLPRLLISLPRLHPAMLE